jgi:arylsulfatase A-like enzyme
MPDRRPNILFVLTDQQRHDTIAAAGNTYIKTPTMDSLCREGTRFDRAYTPSPVCVSARGSLISPPTPWNKLYRGPKMPRPKRCDFQEDLWTYFNRHQNRYKYRDQGLDDNLLRVMRAHYWACVSFIDYHVGRIVAQLEAMDELDNTLIVWSSDPGEFLGDYDCFGKRSFLDPAGRVPILVPLPARFPSGTVEETPRSLVDLIPTFLGVANVEIDETELDGVDLAELIGSEDNRTVYGQLQRADRGVYAACDRSLKYFYSAPDQKEYLIDLKADVEETRNCAENTLYQNEVAEMRSRLIGHFKAHGYLDPIEGDNWKVFPKKTVPDSPDAGLLIQDAEWSKPHHHIPGYSE